VDTGQARCMTSNKNKFVITANGIVVSTPCHYWSIVYGMCDHLLFVANSNSIIQKSAQAGAVYPVLGAWTGLSIN